MSGLYNYDPKDPANRVASRFALGRQHPTCVPVLRYALHAALNPDPGSIIPGIYDAVILGYCIDNDIDFDGMRVITDKSDLGAVAMATYMAWRYDKVLTTVAVLQLHNATAAEPRPATFVSSIERTNTNAGDIFRWLDASIRQYESGGHDG